MDRSKGMLIGLLVVAALLAGFLAWRSFRPLPPAEIDQSTQETLEGIAKRTGGDPELAAYLADHDAASLSEEELAELIDRFQRERDAGESDAEPGSALRAVQD